MLNLFRVVVLSVFLASLSFSVCSAGSFPSQAIVVAEQFTVFLDKQDYSTAYNNGSEILRVLHAKSDWIKKRERSDILLGSVQERKLASIRARNSYPGLPDGDYLVVYYEAQTQHKQKAAEVLLVKLVGDSWQVCSYRLE